MSKENIETIDNTKYINWLETKLEQNKFSKMDLNSKLPSSFKDIDVIYTRWVSSSVLLKLISIIFILVFSLLFGIIFALFFIFQVISSKDIIHLLINVSVSILSLGILITSIYLIKKITKKKEKYISITYCIKYLKNNLSTEQLNNLGQTRGAIIDYISSKTTSLGSDFISFIYIADSFFTNEQQSLIAPFEAPITLHAGRKPVFISYYFMEESTGSYYAPIGERIKLRNDNKFEKMRYVKSTIPGQDFIANLIVKKITFWGERKGFHYMISWTINELFEPYEV